MHDKLPVLELRVGASVPGIWRGQTALEVPQVEGKGGSVLGRVFLDTETGPAAFEVDEDALAQCRGLGLADGDRITLSRPAADVYQVVKHMPDA